MPKDGIDVEDKWAPDIDFEYALTEHIGLELLLTIPQKHEVIATETALGPEVRLGTVTHLPPTLTAKYYFLTDKVRPYVGAALQAGVDFQVNDRWHVSLDAKKAWIRTDVSLGGTKLTTVKVDPYILGIGVGYRFGN